MSNENKNIQESSKGSTNVSKKRLTPHQKMKSEQLKKDRIKIANMIARKPEIQKHCCICGNTDAQILHNKNNPYMITFICKDCRNDAEKLESAKSYRFDIRSVMDKSTLSAKSFIDTDVKAIVDGFLNDLLSIGAYCTKIGISRHQFNEIVKRYATLFDMPTIKKTVDAHTNKINRENLSELALERNKF